MTGRSTTPAGTEPLSGVVTPEMRAAARRPAPQPPSPRLAIGYGPGPATDGRVAGARSMIVVGLSVALGTVAVRPEVIAFDIARTSDRWWSLAALAVAVGTVLGVRMDRRSEQAGSAGATVAALVASVAWLTLFNTGEPRYVEALLVVAVAASVPFLLSQGDARRARPDRSSTGAAVSIGVAVALGVGVGAFVPFVDPDVPWATTAAVGGGIALLGALRRLRLPDAVFGPRSIPASSDGPTAVGTAALLGACLGPILVAGLRLQPYLDEGWQVGVRYQFLVVEGAGAVAVATLGAVYWWHQDHDGDLGLETAFLALLGAASLLLVAPSQTLPGTVGGSALAVGVAGAALVLAGATTGAAPFLAAISGIVAALWWGDLVDAAGSNRASLALVALPALVLAGATVAGSSGARTASATPTPATSATPAGTTEPIDLTSAVPHPDLAPTRTPLLEVRGVEFSYGSVQALFGVDLDVHDGEITAIVGANGAGKTTFLRTVAGLATPSAGTIRLGGRDLAPFSAADRVLLGINQIAAGGAVAEDLSVGDNLAMFGHTLPSREARAGRQRVLEVFPQFADRLGQRASSLSGGERQMLALTKSLVLRPRLLIIDELSLGLAPIIVSSLIPVIRRLHAEGASVLLVEQSVTVALELADRASCMERGRIVYSSSADELRADPHLLEAAYLEGITAALEHRGMGA